MYKIRHFLPLCRNCFRNRSSRIIYQIKPFSSQKGNADYDDGPIKFTTSKASKYSAKISRTGIEDDEDRLWYEPYVIIVSLVAFLVYFCILREENDIDRELEVSLYSRIEGLEELQLKLSLQYNLDKGLDTAAIRQRLAEIEEEKKHAKKSTSD